MKLKIRSTKLKDRYIYIDIDKQNKSTTLVVVLSGLSGNDSRSLTKKTCGMFGDRRIDTLRINFCNDDKPKNHKTDALNIEQMSLLVYTSVLKEVLGAMKEKYSHIVFVAHSFSAPVVINFLQKNFKYQKNTTLILWDPSLLPWGRKTMEEVFVFNKEKNLFVQKETSRPLTINRIFYKELLGTKNTASILKKINIPVLIIGAEKGAKEDAQAYFVKIQNKRSAVFHVIKKADHLFKEKNIRKELLNRTIAFLNQKD